jgi:hypothetical protein
MTEIAAVLQTMLEGWRTKSPKEFRVRADAATAALEAAPLGKIVKTLKGMSRADLRDIVEAFRVRAKELPLVEDSSFEYAVVSLAETFATIRLVGERARRGD